MDQEPGYWSSRARRPINIRRHSDGSFSLPDEADRWLRRPDSEGHAVHLSRPEAWSGLPNDARPSVDQHASITSVAHRDQLNLASHVRLAVINRPERREHLLNDVD